MKTGKQFVIENGFDINQPLSAQDLAEKGVPAFVVCNTCSKQMVIISDDVKIDHFGYTYCKLCAKNVN